MNSVNIQCKGYLSLYSLEDSFFCLQPSILVHQIVPASHTFGLNECKVKLSSFNFSVSDLCTRSMCNSVGFLPVQFHVVPRSNITDWLTFLSLSPTIIHILALFYGTSCI